MPSEVVGVSAAGSREAFLVECIRLCDATNAASVLDRALQLIVARTSSELGYIELYEDEERATPALCCAVHCSQDDTRTIADAISRGIISLALAEGRSIRTSSALHDERFRDNGSVRQNQIGSALCVPIGALVTVGAIYIQARKDAVLRVADVEDTELVAAMLDLVLHRVARPGATTLTEAVRAFQFHRVREALQRHNGNISAAATELGVTRKFIYAVMRR